MSWINANSTDDVRIEVVGEARAVTCRGARWIKFREDAQLLLAYVEQRLVDMTPDGVVFTSGDWEEADALRAIIDKVKGA